MRTSAICKVNQKTLHFENLFLQNIILSKNQKTLKQTNQKKKKTNVISYPHLPISSDLVRNVNYHIPAEDLHS